MFITAVFNDTFRQMLVCYLYKPLPSCLVVFAFVYVYAPSLPGLHLGGVQDQLDTELPVFFY